MSGDLRTVAITRDTPVGFEFRGPSRKLARERVWAFSGGPFALEGWPKRNQHTDDAFAKERGLQSARVSGTQYLGYVCGLLVDLFEEGWLSAGTIAAKYVASVQPGDVIYPVATVARKEAVGDAIRFHMEIRCENELGQPVLVGTATGIR
jgi:hypothetical protein